MKKHYENIDIYFNGLGWKKGLMPAIIGGLLIYFGARYYSYEGVDTALDVVDTLIKDREDVKDTQ